MTKWIIAVALLISGSILGAMYYQLGQFSRESGEESAPNPSAIRIVDGYRDGVHRLSGTIKLPHSCFSIKTDSSLQEYEPGTVIVRLTSKDNMLEESVCANIRTRYPFETIVETQQKITVRLFLDGNEFPTVVSQVDWLDPSGNVITPDTGL